MASVYSVMMEEKKETVVKLKDLRCSTCPCCNITVINEEIKHTKVAVSLLFSTTVSPLGYIKDIFRKS